MVQLYSRDGGEFAVISNAAGFQGQPATVRFASGEFVIVWTSFVGRDPQLAKAVRAAETYVRDELGDARLFSLDSPKSRASRIALLRRAN